MVFESALSRLYRMSRSPLFALRREAQRSLGKGGPQCRTHLLRLKTNDCDDRRSAELESSRDGICAKRSAEQGMKHLGPV